MRIEQRLSFGPVTGYRVAYAPVIRPLMAVIAYQVDNVLIDSGPQNARASILKLLAPDTLSGIYLTHYHEDHAGNAAYLSKHFDLPVFGHPETCRRLKSKVHLKPYEKFMWGGLETLDVKPLEDSFATERYTFQVIHTPGHSSDHVVFYEANMGWLFSGDMYLGSRIRYFRADEDLQQTIQSLKLLSQLDIACLFCGHNPKFEQPVRNLRQKCQYLEDILGSVANLVSQGLSDTEILRKLVAGREDWVAKVITLGDASFRNMILSALRFCRTQRPCDTESNF